MNVIKLKDLLRELQLKEAPVADQPPIQPVQFVMPPAQISYAAAASDGAGKPYTQPDIDFSGTGDDSQLITKASNVIKQFENSKNSPKGGYNKASGKWFPHKSLEGGSDTIAYGHKIQKGEDFSKGITDSEAERLLEKDIREKIRFAKTKMKNFDGMPLTVKIAVINALFRGDMGPRTMTLLSQNKYAQAAREYLNHQEYRTTSNKGVKKRMDWNYNVLKGAA
jgi:lysozyme